MRGEYAHVVDVLEPLIGGEAPAIQDDVLLRESRKYLGAAYVLTGQEELGEQQFEALLIAEGDAFDRYLLDAAAFPSRVHAAFDAVRERLLRRRRQSEADVLRRQEADEQRRRAALFTLVEQAEEDEVVIEHDRLLAWVPFGAGQFQNGNEDLGWFFAISEGATLLVGSVAFSIYYNGELDRRSSATPVLSNAFVDAMYFATQITGAVMATLLLAGIIEAHVSFVPSHTVRRRRSVPEPILQDLGIAVGAGSVSLRLRF